MAEGASGPERIRRAAAALGLSIDIRDMDRSTRTAEDAAAACGVSVGQIVKSLVFVGAESAAPYLLLVSGVNRVNETAMPARLGETLKRADADRVRDLTGFAIGGVPPFGHAVPLRTFIDEDLLAFDVVWAAAGTPRAVFSVAPRDLADAIGAKPIAVT
jgi:prolyl-tRNA editing enzyme YbaK/EbsC (Cys-tRNA(Pro) deacylase)